MSIDLKQAFDVDPERYHRYRPTYPPEVIQRVISTAGLAGEALLLEIGPGTGQATRAFAERGFRITAVELGARLAETARTLLSHFPNVRIITGAYEAADLPENGFDLVYAATAFHWIERRAKYARTHQLLKPGGHLAILHAEQVSDEQGDRFFFARQPVYHRHTPSREAGSFRLPRCDELRAPSDVDNTLFSQVDFATYRLIKRYAADDYIGLLSTFSPTIALGDRERRLFLKEIGSIIRRDFSGVVEIHFGISITILRRT